MEMESRKLSAVLSSMVSQLLLLLSLLFFESDSDSQSQSSQLSLPLALTHDLAAALSVLSLSLSRRRKRPRSDASEDPDRLSFLRRPRAGPDPFRSCFLMTASTFEWLAGSLEPLLDCRDPAGEPLRLSADLRLAVGLHRLASGADYADAARRFGVAESAARFCAKQLCRVLCTNFRFWVDLLSPADLAPVSAAFRSLSGLPNCCGALLCASFPAGNPRPIAAQIVADPSSRILAVAAGFPGDESDREILTLSALSEDIGAKKLLNSPPVEVNGVPVDQYLIGDRNHPLLPWLMVPFSAAAAPAPGSAEECFDEALAEMRLSAAKTVASLRKWGVLSRPIQEEEALKAGAAYVGACSILHNALLMREDYSALADESEARSWSSERDGKNTGDFDRDDDSSAESRAVLVRNALAAKAKEFRDSNKS